MKMNKEEEFDELYKLAQKSRKSSRIVAIISVVAVLGGFVSLIVGFFNKSTETTQVLDSLEKNKLVIDSLKITTDSLITNVATIDTTRLFVERYLSTIKTSDNLSEYYSDSVRRYYLITNITLDKIKKEQARHNQRFPRAKLAFDKDDIIVKHANSDTTEVFVDTEYYPDSLNNKSQNIIYQIKINKERKVFFVRNLLPQENKKAVR